MVVFTRAYAPAGGIPAGRTLAPVRSGRDGELAGRVAAQPAAVLQPLELGADFLALAAAHVDAGPLGGHRAGHRPAGLGCCGGYRLDQRPVVLWQVARAGRLAARGYQHPETSLDRKSTRLNSSHMSI